MSQAVTSIEDIDLEISVACIVLRAARASYDRCPSAANERRVADAGIEVDRLLDARLVAAN